MPLPKKTIRVFPNPWGFIHHETGPQGHCHEDTGGRGTDPRYIGAEVCPQNTVLLNEYEKDKTGTRHNEWSIVFRFPALNAELTGPAEGFEHGIELAKTPYYLDRLRDGDLIPADERSGEHGARFKSLAEAKDAGIAAFAAHYGDDAFEEVMAALSEATPAPAAPAAPPAVATAPATPDAKAARVSKPPAPSSDNGGQP